MGEYSFPVPESLSLLLLAQQGNIAGPYGQPVSPWRGSAPDGAGPRPDGASGVLGRSRSCVLPLPAQEPGRGLAREGPEQGAAGATAKGRSAHHGLCPGAVAPNRGPGPPAG